MGARLSGSVAPPLKSRPGLDDLPESCIALIFAQMDPPDIGRFAVMNRAFCLASLADFVWESKLPSNYKFLVHKLFGEIPERLSKKDIYVRLCRPVRFDAGTKEIWLEKSSGKMCMAISWKGLRITGIDDRRYWSHLPTEESRFHAVAYLHQVWWLEVSGELEFSFPAGSSSVFFRLLVGKPTKRHGHRACDLDHVHGWDTKPVRFRLSTVNNQHEISHCYFLMEVGKWGYYHAGDFTVDDPNKPVKINFSMNQIDCTHTKGGLCLDSVIICPSELREKLVEW
ncbi:hypothetical protein Nepgr_020247 [Nepenthes gracilis]|uniref:F-box domain-containing protein n=1 Tax=Nepenthes gracilis TaxID=150966 RepID=A0AAD3XW62_NEPGR|nr:hypothetical protein Nepgr_020247 [Nepenthes gracilis]